MDPQDNFGIEWIEFDHIGNLDEAASSPSNEGDLGLRLGFEMLHRCLISCVHMQLCLDLGILDVTPTPHVGGST